MDAPQNVWVVIDEDAPVYIACWPEHCHQHINDAIESELDGAGNMVVREYVLAAEVQRLRDAAGKLSVQSVAYPASPPVPIRFAIDAARAAQGGE